jgi:hypothetical protein
MAINFPLPDPLVIDTPNRGRLTMKWLTVAGIGQLERLRREKDDSGFLLHALALHLINPPLTADDLASWDPTDLIALARGWSGHVHALDRELGEGEIADEFGRAFDRYRHDTRISMRDTVSPIFESIRRQNQQMEAILGPTRAIQQILRLVERQESLWHSDWARQFQQLQDSIQSTRFAFDPLVAHTRLASRLAAAVSQNALLHSLVPQLPALTEALRLSTAYQTSLSQIGVAHVQWAPTADRLLDGLESLSVLSSTVLDDWATGATLPADPIARQAPVIELYSASSASAALVGGEIERPPESVGAQFDAVTLQIEPALARVDAHLVDTYRGAADVIHRGGPDHVRHFAVSLRELLTHLLHTLAPDDELRKWQLATPDDYHNGRPTRRLRLRYIFRHANSTTYTSFIADDIKRTVEMIDILNADTHRLFAEADADALRLVLRRVEGVLAILLEAAHRL